MVDCIGATGTIFDRVCMPGLFSISAFILTLWALGLASISTLTLFTLSKLMTGELTVFGDGVVVGDCMC